MGGAVEFPLAPVAHLETDACRPESIGPGEKSSAYIRSLTLELQANSVSGRCLLRIRQVLECLVVRHHLSVSRRQMRSNDRPGAFWTRGAGVQTGMHRVLLLWSHICNACHVLQLRRGAGVQKFATARWLVNGCQSTPTVHIRKGNPSASARPKVRGNRMDQGVTFAVLPHFADNAEIRFVNPPWMDPLNQ